jgi:molybdenum cofactor biosynthesis enzyme MoaA
MSDELDRRLKELKDEDNELSTEQEIKDFEKRLRQRKDEFHHPQRTKAIRFLKGATANFISHAKRYRDAKSKKVFE